MAKNPIDFPLVRLTDVAEILDPEGFAKKLAAAAPKSELTFIICPDEYEPGKLKMDIVEGSGIEDAYAIFPKPDISLIYLAAILNTDVVRQQLAEGQPDEAHEISLQALSDLPVRKLEQKEMTSIGYLHYLLSSIESLEAAAQSNRQLSDARDLFTDLKNVLALELVRPAAFQEHQSSAFAEWFDLISPFFAREDRYDVKSISKDLCAKLQAPGNQLMERVRQFKETAKSI